MKQKGMTIDFTFCVSIHFERCFNAILRDAANIYHHITSMVHKWISLTSTEEIIPTDEKFTTQRRSCPSQLCPPQIQNWIP